MYPVLYRGTTVLQWPMNLTDVWTFVLDACELIHVFVCEAKTAMCTPAIRHANCAACVSVVVTKLLVVGAGVKGQAGKSSSIAHAWPNKRSVSCPKGPHVTEATNLLPSLQIFLKAITLPGRSRSVQQRTSSADCNCHCRLTRKALTLAVVAQGKWGR